MKKHKKFAAILGLVALILLYLSTLIFAFLDNTKTHLLFMTSISATIFFPIVLYVLTILHKYSNKDDSSSSDDEV